MKVERGPFSGIIGLIAWSPALILLAIGIVLTDSQIYEGNETIVFGILLVLSLAILTACFKVAKPERTPTKFAKALAIIPILAAISGFILPHSISHMPIFFFCIFGGFPIVILLFLKFGKL